jgi:adenosine 3'-phospho 5'-phosphosulfate transporter B3
MTLMEVTLGQFFGCTVLALLGGGCGGAPQGPRQEGLVAWARAWLPFVGLSCLVWCGTGLANVAVSWVQYPVKVVFKSSKLIPTMGVSVLMGNSRAFGALDYLAAVCLCGGAAGFSFHAGKGGESSQLVALGIALLTCTMFCDAVSANTQQLLMQRTGVPPMVMMLRLNFCGVLVSLAIIAASGQAGVAAGLLVSEPLVLAYMAGVGGSIAVGVWANTVLISEAGSVVAVGVATVRKVVTMALSYAIYKKPFERVHVVAFVLMVVGLVLSEVVRTRPRAPDESKLSEKSRLVQESDRLEKHV